MLESYYRTSDSFENFCLNIRINKNDILKIAGRYKRITNQINKDFWSIESDLANTLIVGSYGRDTEIHTSDIDLIAILPWEYFYRFDSYSSNGQSSLLQLVKDSIKKTYSTSHLRGDGQVVQIKFEDGINFEIVPAFPFANGKFYYPDSNRNGSWRVTDPRNEILAMKQLDDDYYGNLKQLCRMTRVWKEYCNVPMGGLLIDTLAASFLENWPYRYKTSTYYDWMIRDFFAYLKEQKSSQNYWFAIGSKQHVYRKGYFEYKSKIAYNNAVDAISYGNKNMPYSANSKWKEIFGSKFNG